MKEKKFIHKNIIDQGCGQRCGDLAGKRSAYHLKIQKKKKTKIVLASL